MAVDRHCVWRHMRHGRRCPRGGMADRVRSRYYANLPQLVVLARGRAGPSRQRDRPAPITWRVACGRRASRAAMRPRSMARAMAGRSFDRREREKQGTPWSPDTTPPAPRRTVRRGVLVREGSVAERQVGGPLAGGIDAHRRGHGRRGRGDGRDPRLAARGSPEISHERRGRGPGGIGQHHPNVSGAMWGSPSHMHNPAAGSPRDLGLPRCTFMRCTMLQLLGHENSVDHRDDDGRHGDQ